MISRLQYFLTIDDAARQRAALIAAVAGFLSGILLQWGGGEPFDVSAYFSVAVASGVFTLRTWRYCLSAKSRLAKPVFERRRILRLAAVSVVVVLLCVLPAPRVEARVLDYRLRALTSGPSLHS